jgi:dipeptidyl aminopeptidase/acylaminoacyl peptidase
MATLSRAFAALPLTALALLAAPALHAQAPAAPMTAQDLVTLDRLGGTAVSPDGAWVVFARTVTDPQSYKRTTSLWAKSLARPAQPPVRLALPEGASEPAFDHTGRLYYLAEGKADAASDAVGQVWSTALDAAGAVSGAPVQVSAFKAEVSGFKLSPDGRRIAVWGDLARDCPTFGGCAEGNAALTGPGSGRLYRDGAGFVRHWDQWETPGNYSRIFTFALTPQGTVDFATGKPADGPAGAGALVGDAPTKPFGDGAEVAWSADSSALVFAARRADRDEPRSTNIDLWWSALDGSAPRNLTEANKATDTMPAISPDGRWLAYAAMARPGYESDRLVVMLRDIKSGATRALTQGWDRSPTSLQWTPDGKALIATAEDVLDTPAFRIDPASGKVTRLSLAGAREGNIGHVTPLNDGRLLFSRDTIDTPAELYVGKPGKAPVRLTDLNTTRLAAKGQVTTRRFSFKGANGDTVWGQIVKPAGVTGKLPEVLLVHGGPQGSFNDAWSFRWNPRTIASQGYAAVTIDFHGSTGYGQAFVDAINQDWGGKPLEDLQKGLAAAEALDAQIDGGNACAMGASYGGYMMNWIEGAWPDRFKCIVQHDGVFDARAMAYETEELWFDEWEHGGKTYFEAPEAYEKWNPVNLVAKWQTPMLVITSEKDFRIPYTQGLAAFSALQTRKVPSELLVFPDENHWVLKPRNSLQWHRTVFAWLGRWLRGDGQD